MQGNHTEHIQYRPASYTVAVQLGASLLHFLFFLTKVTYKNMCKIVFASVELINKS